MLLVANGVSNPPTFTGFTPVGSAIWANTAGSVNVVSFGADDDLTPIYGISVNCETLAGVPVPNSIPTPTSFTTSPGGSTIVIGFSAGLAAVTPPVSAFAMSVSRPSDAPAATPAPPTLASVSAISSGATSVVLNVSGGTWLANDVITLSYLPAAVTLQPGSGQSTIALLQDTMGATSGCLSNKLPAWTTSITVP